METPFSSSFSAIIFLIITRLMSIVGKVKTPNSSSSSSSSLPPEIFSLGFAPRLRSDPGPTTDFGKIVQETPAAVLYPTSVSDIVDLVKFSHDCPSPFPVAARGYGHSVRGQAMAKGGVVVEMTSLGRNRRRGEGIRVSWSDSLGFFADVGGDELWVDVLRASLEYGLAPVSWTDYLYLTVGGTLSNAGISGQTFRHGPQISNVHEMDVITGKGELLTCSKNMNSELFFAVLGGLGQFGIITRARIVLDRAPTRVKWVRMLYDDFSKFTRDQEYLISIDDDDDGLDYVEGSLVMDQSSPNNWRSSFFSTSHQSQISELISKHGIIYSLEIVKYYDDYTSSTIDEEMEGLVGGLSYKEGLVFKREASYFEFLNRVRVGEVKLRQKGEWDVPHPWLNLFVPKSRILDFNVAVFVDIILRHNNTFGPILVYPTLSTKWDKRMSAVIPEEETFYCVGLLHSCSGLSEWEDADRQNQQILDYCSEAAAAGIKIKQYLPHYKSQEDWSNHFGSKWNLFQFRKSLFDPKFILSPGQRIFDHLASSSSSSSSSCITSSCI